MIALLLALAAAPTRACSLWGCDYYELDGCRALDSWQGLCSADAAEQAAKCAAACGARGGAVQKCECLANNGTTAVQCANEAFERGLNLLPNAVLCACVAKRAACLRQKAVERPECAFDVAERIDELRSDRHFRAAVNECPPIELGENPCAVSDWSSWSACSEVSV